jgi:hypothetical protein
VVVLVSQLTDWLISIALLSVESEAESQGHGDHVWEALSNVTLHSSASAQVCIWLQRATIHQIPDQRQIPDHLRLENAQAANEHLLHLTNTSYGFADPAHWYCWQVLDAWAFAVQVTDPSVNTDTGILESLNKVLNGLILDELAGPEKGRVLAPAFELPRPHRHSQGGRVSNGTGVQSIPNQGVGMVLVGKIACSLDVRQVYLDAHLQPEQRE